MGANTEMSRLDSIPTEKLNDILGLDTDTLGEIPAPESTDEGKVLGVSNGSYALVNGGGGGGSMTIVGCVTDPETEAMTLDMTAKDLFDLFKTGETIMVRDISMEGFEMYNKLISAMYTESTGYKFTTVVITTPVVITAEDDDDYPTVAGK